MSSHHVIVRIRHGGFGVDRIGHGGTLDPLATGLLVVLVGRAVKLSEYITGHDKTYTVKGILGKMRDTFDEEGKIIGVDDTPVNRQQMEKAIAEFPKEYYQMPPDYSAIKINGIASYKRAREGKVTNLVSRRVLISRMELVDFNYPEFDLHVTVSAGTYIRSLIVDIAARLNTLAYVGRLRRNQSGSFSINQAFKLNDVLNFSAEKFHDTLLPMESAVMDFPAVNLSKEQAEHFACGKWLKVEDITDALQNTKTNQLFRLRCEGNFFALGFFDEGYLKHEKVLLR